MTDEEKKPYHSIMVDAWRIFIKENPHKRYSDKWWTDIINEYENLRKPYIGTELDDFTCRISQVFLDEYEDLQRRNLIKGERYHDRNC